MTSRPVSSKIVGLLGGTAKEEEKTTFSSHIKYVKEHKRHDPDSNLLCKQEKRREVFFSYKYIKAVTVMKVQAFHNLYPSPE